MIIAKGREIPTIELLYICDDDFKKDVEDIRRKYLIRTIDDEYEKTVPIEDIVKFDKKLILNRKLNAQYYKDISLLLKKHNLEGLDDDLATFIESGELLRMNMTNSIKSSEVKLKT